MLKNISRRLLAATVLLEVLTTQSFSQTNAAPRAGDNVFLPMSM